VRRQLARPTPFGADYGSGWVDMSSSDPCARIGGSGAMLTNCREPEKRDGVGPHGTRPDAGFDLKAVRTGIGAALRTLHSDVLREEVPDRIAELLKRLDQQKDADSAWRL
jgi:anti-sigma factor NepR-like protein